MKRQAQIFIKRKEKYLGVPSSIKKQIINTDETTTIRNRKL
jgi:hypothetical protein